MAERITTTASWLSRLRAQIDAGRLGITAEDEARIEAEARTRRDRQAEVLRDRRLAALRAQLPEHYDWAREYPRARWTQIRRDLRSALDAHPRDWILLGTPVGNAKTTAMVYEAARAICTGRSVRYVSSSIDWRTAIQGSGYTMTEYLECDLLLVDELHWLGRLPDWIVSEAMGVIDARYRQRRTRQTIGAGSLPISQLRSDLPPGLVDRFDRFLGAAEESQRRRR